MDNKTVLKNLNKDIKDIEIIVKSLDNNSKIRQIDIDLALSKIRNLYDKFLLLDNINLENPILVNDVEVELEKEDSISSLSEDKILEEKDIISIPKEKKEESAENEKEEKEKKKKNSITIKRTKGITDEDLENITIEPEKINQKIAEKKVEETPIAKEKVENIKIKDNDKPKKSIKIQTNSNIVADKFTTNQKSINEKIAENKKIKDLATKLKDKHVSDINKIISLNDKIRFIKVLFNGDKLLYNKTIDAVNSFDSIDMVNSFFNKNFSWNKDNKDYISFFELISKRFL